MGWDILVKTSRGWKEVGSTTIKSEAVRMVSHWRATGRKVRVRKW